MKNLISTFVMLAMTLSFYDAPASSTAVLHDNPVISFKEKSHDFGEIIRGDHATYVFKFTNTGDQPLVIEYVEKACGCMEPTWPKEPIMPGAVGEIKVTYTTKSRPGEFRKTLKVVSNSEEQVMLLIKGNVVPEKK